MPTASQIRHSLLGAGAAVISNGTVQPFLGAAALGSGGSAAGVATLLLQCPDDLDACSNTSTSAAGCSCMAFRHLDKTSGETHVYVRRHGGPHRAAREGCMQTESGNATSDHHHRNQAMQAFDTAGRSLPSGLIRLLR